MTRRWRYSRMVGGQRTTRREGADNARQAGKSCVLLVFSVVRTPEASRRQTTRQEGGGKAMQSKQVADNTTRG